MGNYYSTGVSNEFLYFDVLSTDLKKLLLCYIPEHALDLTKPDDKSQYFQSNMVNKLFFKQNRHRRNLTASFESTILDERYWTRLYQEEFSNSPITGNAFETYFNASHKWSTVDEMDNLDDEDFISDFNNKTHRSLYLSINEGWEIKLDILLKNLHPNIAFSDPFIFNAFRYNRVSIIKYLIEAKGVNLFGYKDHILHSLANYAKLDIVKYLSSIEFLDQHDFTTILQEAPHYFDKRMEIINGELVISWKNPNEQLKEFVKFLIDYGANIKILTEESQILLENMLK